MKTSEVRAPGVVKLFGEHAVVYGKLSVAAAVGMYATVSVEETKGTELRIALLDFSGFAVALDKRRLGLLYRRYKNRKSLEEYITANSDIDPRLLPYATIAARLSKESGVDVLGRDVKITSEIPRQSGCASSAACSAAFTVAILSSAGESLGDKTAIDIARDGERVVHKSDGAGRIDVTTSYYGGYVSTAGGGRREEIGTRMNMVLIDTGPKKSTAETVGNVRKKYEAERDKTEGILNEIDKCAVEGLKALAEGDLREVGRLMYEDQELLRKLGVSSEGLDKAVGIAMENGAYGAKLSGGGGGGIAIAICRNSKELIGIMEGSGFKAYGASIALKGARSYLE
ncbi:MAG TPA: mevalonate kinase [Candidatus Saccharimonadales bacterium]|nr:mevalonate kinase [Candidatus Saccharimonadales bacterium]